MAKLIPFKKLKPNTVYFEQSRYWHKLLGPCTVVEFVDGLPLLVKNESGEHYVDPDWDWFWEGEPSEEEQRNLRNTLWR